MDKLTKVEAEIIRNYLKGQFPWLGVADDAYVSGADTIEQLESCYNTLETIQ